MATVPTLIVALTVTSTAASLPSLPSYISKCGGIPADAPNECRRAPIITPCEAQLRFAAEVWECRAREAHAYVVALEARLAARDPVRIADLVICPACPQCPACETLSTWLAVSACGAAGIASGLLCGQCIGR